MNYYSNHRDDLGQPQQLLPSPYRQQHSALHTQLPLLLDTNPIPDHNQDLNFFTSQIQDQTTVISSRNTSRAIRPIPRSSLSHNPIQLVHQNHQQNAQDIHDPYTHHGKLTSAVIQSPQHRAHPSSKLSHPQDELLTPIPNSPLDGPPISDISANNAHIDMTPPPEATYATFEELISHANQHAFAHGYALVIARSKKKGPHNYKKVLIACDRWGPVQHSGLRPEHLRKRSTTSKKTDCKFGVLAQEGATEWKLCHRPDASFSTHNHGPSQDMSKHAAARKLNASALAAVKVLSDAGVSVKETVERIQAVQPGAMIIARDVYNARAMLKREPSKFPEIDPELLPPIFTRAKLTPEEKIRDECRVELARANKDLEETRNALEKLRQDTTATINDLKQKIVEKDKQITKFEMFIDICNERVMAQRERIFNDGNPVPSARSND